MKRYETYKDSGVEWLGKIPEHWEVVGLKWVSRLQYGESLAVQDRKEGDIPVYGSNGIVGYHNEAITQAPCIIVGRKGSFGKINLSEEPCFPIDTTYFIDGSATSNNLYWLAYVLPLLGLDENSRDSAVPGLNREDAYANCIPTPPLEEQQHIAAYLDAQTTQIDDLIDKKRRMIALLQEERAAVINRAVTKGLDPAVRMKDSGVEWIGEVPEHWEVVPLTKYMQSIADYRGRTPKKGPTGLFLVTARNIKNGIIDYSLSEEYVDEEDAQLLLQRGKPKVGDVLLTTEAPLGEVANVDREDIALAQRVIKFDGKNKLINNYFLKLWMSCKTFQNDLLGFATGSTALGIKASKLHYLRLMLSPLEEQTKIVEFVTEKTSQIDTTINQAEKQIKLLQEYRTVLISEVVTGKVDVRGEGVAG